MTVVDAASALFAAARSVAQLERFLSQGEVTQLLVDPLMNAARDAFGKVPSAADPRQQLWSAVNHLESAHHTLRVVYGNAWPIQLLASRLVYLGRMAHKDRLVLCLMACCYRVLSERKLCESAIAEADKVDTGRFWREPVLGFWSVLDWRLHRELYYEGRDVRVNVAEFRECLLSEWSDTPVMFASADGKTVPNC